MPSSSTVVSVVVSGIASQVKLSGGHEPAPLSTRPHAAGIPAARARRRRGPLPARRGDRDGGVVCARVPGTTGAGGANRSAIRRAPQVHAVLAVARGERPPDLVSLRPGLRLGGSQVARGGAGAAAAARHPPEHSGAGLLARSGAGTDVAL